MGFGKWAIGRKRKFSGKASGRRKRHIPGEMNKAEALFAETLEARPDVLSWEFERWTLTLTKGCIKSDADPRQMGKEADLAKDSKFTPDFRCLVEHDGCIQTVFYEVKAQWGKGVKRKAHWEPDAREKMKMAAELHPEYHWIGVSRNQDGTYQEEIFGAE